MTNVQNFNEEGYIPDDYFAFPRGVFPSIIEEIMDKYNHILNLNYDYIGSTILTALSLAIGNQVKIRIKNGWVESPIIWMVLVGRAGINKSSPIDTFLKPFIKRDEHYFQIYKKELIEYELKLQKKNKKKKSNPDNDASVENMIAPKRKQTLLRDFTPESFFFVHEINLHGLLIYTDEILNWLKNYNRYNSSGEEQLYLSLWSGKSISVNRKNSTDIFIANPFINVCGTIQPSKFYEAFGKGREKSGFTHRFLFAYPKKVLRKAFSDEEISESIELAYDKIIAEMLKINTKSNLSQPKIFEFDNDVKIAFKEWREINNDRINNELNDELTGIYAKLEIYLPRIALILQILEDSLQEIENHQIHLNAFQSSIKLISYYEKTAVRVYRQISKYNDPLACYPSDKREFYRTLSNEFTTTQAKNIAERMNIPERTIFEFFKDENLFERTSHGRYLKKV
ncbi:MAG: DUF3987 domain-containing protein [Bacteroidales bacterium]|jgi:hypothetical protein|nr:DUF3987 domain-containing protein [Bacteroidales bacterium]